MVFTIRAINILVFSLITIVIGLICYEGLVLEWFSFVPIFILLADIGFILATVLNIIYFRTNRTILIFSIFSIILIMLAIIMKILRIEYPKITLLLWDFYILFFHGILIIKVLFKTELPQDKKSRDFKNE